MGGGLEATYSDHLRLIGKRVGDFLLVLIELFSLGFTAEALRAIIRSKSAISLRLCIELWDSFDACVVSSCGIWAGRRPPLGSSQAERIV